jgi:hypothetical protein
MRQYGVGLSPLTRTATPAINRGKRLSGTQRIRIAISERGKSICYSYFGPSIAIKGVQPLGSASRLGLATPGSGCAAPSIRQLEGFGRSCSLGAHRRTPRTRQQGGIHFRIHEAFWHRTLGGCHVAFLGALDIWERRRSTAVNRDFRLARLASESTRGCNS